MECLIFKLCLISKHCCKWYPKWYPWSHGSQRALGPTHSHCEATQVGEWGISCGEAHTITTVYQLCNILPPTSSPIPLSLPAPTYTWTVYYPHLYPINSVTWFHSQLSWNCLLLWSQCSGFTWLEAAEGGAGSRWGKQLLGRLRWSAASPPPG